MIIQFAIRRCLLVLSDVFLTISNAFTWLALRCVVSGQRWCDRDPDEIWMRAGLWAICTVGFVFAAYVVAQVAVTIGG